MINRARPIHRQHSQSVDILRGQLWDNQNNQQSMTIGDQSMPMFQDEDSHQIHLDMSSIGHPCNTIQGSTRYLSLMRPGRPCFYYLVGPGQQPRQCYSSFGGVSVFDETSRSPVTSLDQ